MFDNGPTVEITSLPSIQIRVLDQMCIVSEDMWEDAKEVLNVIAEYTGCVNVRKVIAIKMVRAATCSDLREAKLMTEAYFEPKMVTCAERGWYQYS